MKKYTCTKCPKSDDTQARINAHAASNLAKELFLAVVSNSGRDWENDAAAYASCLRAAEEINRLQTEYINEKSLP